MIWTVPGLRIERVTPKIVAADAIVAGTAFTAEGTGFDEGAQIVFVKNAILIAFPALSKALEAKNLVVESDILIKFRLKEAEPPRRGIYDAVLYQPRGKKTVFTIRKKALKIT